MNSSIEHLKLVFELAESCERHDLTVYVYEYSYMAFGSWMIITGKNKHRTKFSWDGKESYLGISMSEFQNSSSMPDWKPVFPNVGGTKKTEAEVFAFVKEVLEKQYEMKKF